MYRKTYALINNDILEENVHKITTTFKYQYYIGVVKNNCYHHGINVISSLLKGGINYLAVSSLDEALEIRSLYKDVPILILEPINIEHVKIAWQNNLTLTIESVDYLKEIVNLNNKFNLKVHFKIDSGMNRLGFKNKIDLEEAYKIVCEHDNIFLEGIYTHFATSGYYDIYYDKQLNKIYDMLQNIDLAKIPIIHFDRSITLVRHKRPKYVTGVRLGIMMYGFDNHINIDTSLKGHLRKIKRNIYLKWHHISPSISQDLKLKTAFSLYTEVLALRKVKKGEKVGYNAEYEIQNDGYLATIPIGYADGVTKKFRWVSINNKKYEIVSETMDMLMVLVDDKVKINDQVEIFGNHISLNEVMRTLNTNSYHLFNMITTRVVRIHQEKGKEKIVKY